MESLKYDQTAKQSSKVNRVKLQALNKPGQLHSSAKNCLSVPARKGGVKGEVSFLWTMGLEQGGVICRTGCEPSMQITGGG